MRGRHSTAGLGLAAAALYSATLYPTITGGDAAELIAATATGGVPHPPGYPLYVLVTAPFTWLPLVPSVAARANLASALCAAAAAALLGWAVLRATDRWWASLVAAALFAFSPVVWLYATSAEVFSLNNLLIAAQLCVFIAAHRQPRRAYDLAGALLLGLGLSNHHTSVVFNGVLYLGILNATWRLPLPRLHLLRALGCFTLGLLPYLYLPLAASRPSAVSWGDTQSLRGFLDHVLRRDYGTFQLASTTETRLPLVVQLTYYARNAVAQFTWVGVALAGWGLFHTLQQRDTRRIGVVTLSAFAAFLLIFHARANLPLGQPLANGVVARFWQAPNLLLCLWAGLGLAALGRLPQHALAVAAVLGVMLLAAWHGRTALRQRTDYVIHDYGASILAAAPANAIVLTRGDLITNAIRYLHEVEELRPDVDVLDLELLTYSWMNRRVRRLMPDVRLPGERYGINGGHEYRLAALIEVNIAQRPLLLCGGYKPGDTSADALYRRMPLGTCERLEPNSTALDVERWAIESEAALPGSRNNMRMVPLAGSWEELAWIDYWEARHRRAHMFLLLALSRQDDPALLRRAAAGLDELVASHPAPPASYYKNLGIARARLAATDAASRAPAIAAFQQYLARADGADPEIPAIRQAILELQGHQ